MPSFIIIIIVIIIIISSSSSRNSSNAMGGGGQRNAGMHTGLWLEILKERVHLKKPGVNVRITLQLT
jgi:hypothetical protein